jgi:predicted amidophosphoribosyltransferase
MECPKCGHKIYLNLTPEEMVYCPYCDQRMIPPKEFNLCPTCGGEFPLGSAYCLSCSKNMLSEEETVIDQPRTQPPLPSRDDIASLVNEEHPAVQNLEPSSISHIGGTQPPVHEELPVGYQAGELRPDHYQEAIPLQQVNEEPFVVGQWPPESLAMPTPEAIPPQIVEEEPVINHPVAQTTLQANEDIALLVNVESPNVQKPPEPQVMPIPEIVPPHLVEETPPPESKHPKAHPVPNLEDIAQTVNEGPPAITQEPTETRTTLKMGDTPPQNEFGFCIACGQKMFSDFLYCPRCGKSTQVPEFHKAPVESRQTRSVRQHEDAVRPENEEPTIVMKPPGPRAMPSPGEIPSKTNEEPPPISIRYAQPKYRPVLSREPISEVMNDRAPAMQPFPRAKASTRALLKPVWLKIKDWSAKAIAPARDFFSGQWRLRRLYGKWVKEKDIAPEDIPTTETLKQIAKEGKPPAYQPTRPVYLILGAIAFIAFFILLGITMSRCSI